MRSFVTSLNKRNTILYSYGLLALLSAAVCLVLVFMTQTQVLGINAFIKPMKFFISIWIFVWTMGWLLHLLGRPGKVAAYSWMLVVIFTFEMVILVGQAANGKLSHFNVATQRDGLLFSLMGIGITILTLWTAYMGYLFFGKSIAEVSPAYLWSIRLGFLVFVIFAFEGFWMASRLAHTVGAPDGGIGLPLVNWSRRYGDLRIAHFLGMHALQLFPLFGYYIARNVGQVLFFGSTYFILVTAVLVRAGLGRPLI